MPRASMTCAPSGIAIVRSGVPIARMRSFSIKIVRSGCIWPEATSSNEPPDTTTAPAAAMVGKANVSPAMTASTLPRPHASPRILQPLRRSFARQILPEVLQTAQRDGVAEDSALYRPDSLRDAITSAR